MENHFWIAGQCHLIEESSGHRHSSARSREAIDLLGLIGPNRLPVVHSQADYEPCLADAILARAYELQLEMERADVGPRNHTKWSALAQTLVERAPEPTRIKQCPIHFETPQDKFGAIFVADSGRIVIDSYHLSNKSVSLLRWALADIENPSTAFGRACGLRRYFLLGGENMETSTSFPSDPFREILTLLKQLGCDDIHFRTSSSAPLVWDLVECVVHTGIGAGMVLEIQNQICMCKFCESCRVHGAEDWSARYWLKYKEPLSKWTTPISEIRITGILSLFRIEPIRRLAKRALCNRLGVFSNRLSISPSTAATILSLAADEMFEDAKSPSEKFLSEPASLCLAALISAASQEESTLPRNWKLTVFRFVDIAEPSTMTPSHLSSMWSSNQTDTPKCWDRLAYLSGGKSSQDAYHHSQFHIRPCRTSLINIFESVEEVWRPCRGCGNESKSYNGNYLQSGVKGDTYFTQQLDLLQSKALVPD